MRTGGLWGDQYYVPNMTRDETYFSTVAGSQTLYLLIFFAADGVERDHLWTLKLPTETASGGGLALESVKKIVGIQGKVFWRYRVWLVACFHHSQHLGLSFAFGAWNATTRESRCGVVTMLTCAPLIWTSSSSMVAYSICFIDQDFTCMTAIIAWWFNP